MKKKWKKVLKFQTKNDENCILTFCIYDKKISLCKLILKEMNQSNSCTQKISIVNFSLLHRTMHQVESCHY